MLVSAAVAKALAAIIFVGTQSDDFLAPQLPLHVEDRGATWLVTGTPYTDARIGMRFIVSHVFIDKNSAEVVGIGNDGRMILTEAEEKHWSASMSPAEYAAVFGPATEFEPDGIRDFFQAAYHGLINKPAAAVDYALVLLQTSARFAGLAKADLAAVEREGVWRVTLKGTEVLAFSRLSGKVLSGAL